VESIRNRDEEYKNRARLLISNFNDANESLPMEEVEKKKCITETGLEEERILKNSFIIDKLSENSDTHKEHEKVFLENVKNKHSEAINEYTNWATSKQLVTDM
jgi:hypothetical protein